MLLFLFTNLIEAQEFKNKNQLKKSTGKTILCNGCWLKKDRVKATKNWHLANEFNLKTSTGFKNYKTISEIRDFYKWFELNRKNQGHEVEVFGIVSVAVDLLSNFDKKCAKLMVNTNELVVFANLGAQRVFEFAFPKMRFIYFSDEKIVGEKANEFDSKLLQTEQCKVVDSLFKSLSEKAKFKLIKMAKGKGFYKFVVPKELYFEGDIFNCKDRINHGKNTILPYYLKN